jgi:hypothetical protein
LATPDLMPLKGARVVLCSESEKGAMLDWAKVNASWMSNG